LTAITNTSLLLNFTNGGIIDTSMSNDLETFGGAQISTTQSKFGGGSIYLDGTGDWVLSPNSQNFDLGGGNFTIECWVYPTTWNATAVGVFGKRATVSTANQIGLEFSGSSGTIRFSYNNAGSEVGVTGANGSLNTWQHIAIVRNGSTITVYKDGVSGGTGTINVSIAANTDAFVLGAVAVNGSYPLTGYIDDLRITKGYARYTANFTAPVGPFNGFGD
jgi:hypothetical protein